MSLTAAEALARSAPPAVARQDAVDPLAPFRQRFFLPGSRIYLDGNSLGALPRETPERLQRVAREEWGEDLIASWNVHRWIHRPLEVGDKIGRLLGAAPGQTAVADSISVNLFKALAGALELRPGRKVILSEPASFPTDLYIAQGLLRLLNQSGQGRTGDEDYRLKTISREEIPAFLETRGEDVAVLHLSHVDFRSGEILDLAGLTAAAHRAGALALWDLAHSAGVLPLALDQDGADFAVGCGYKYLNGGPGSPAFLYVAERHHQTFLQPLQGWLGHASPFDFDTEYRPAPGIARVLCGTPPILSLAALEVGIDLALEADLHLVREKSLALGQLFEDLALQLGARHGLESASPPAPHRGSQVSLRHPHAFPIVQALIHHGVTPDFREPDILRFGFAPLYLSYHEVWAAAQVLGELLESGAWDREEFRVRGVVT
ncbi:MAG: kynureninase [Acidobacteriota bacterium]